jgi:carbon monoxide dehydrogenase subunit G
VKLTHVQILAAPREKVYAALTDPETLKACIEGCETLTPAGPDAYEATLKVWFAAIKGSYKGRVELKDPVPPESLTIHIEGKGLPGFVRSVARVKLAEKDGGTELVGDGDVTVGGLIAAVGSRLVEAAAKKLLSDFFTRLAARL